MAETAESQNCGKHADKADNFYSQPILNSPYEEPTRHWELGADGQPTKNIRQERRKADFITPVPKPKKTRKTSPQAGNAQQTRKAASQGGLIEDKTQKAAEAISNEDQEYHKAIINGIRRHVSQWRKLPKSEWKVSPITARLLEYWRAMDASYNIRPFFCQIEAVETAIWLTEVAPKYPKFREQYLAYLDKAAATHNPGLPRLALKMATGSGKTTVMAMLIAWQTLNAVRGSSAKFSKGFLIVAPGLTIRDRLQVLKPNNPRSYYRERQLAPPDMLRDLQKARIVITNYHAFLPREKYDIASGTRAALEGWRGHSLDTRESEGEMLQRVMPELAGLKNIIVINDEAHHCYKEKITDSDDDFHTLKGVDKTDAKNEAKERREAARVWISGLDAVSRHIGVSRVFDLSATPFFLSGSGYAEGTIFPWTMSDFSLMDAIECGIVKLPRIPISDNISSLEVPMYRNLWDNIRDKMPKKGKAANFDPQSLPSPLITAIDSLYSQYEKTFSSWREAKIKVPPCFIIVCNNTSTSKLIFDYISGYEQTLANGETVIRPGHCPLFRNFEEDGSPLPRPHALLIDSAQLERGDILDSAFREAAKEEIDRFRREILIRGGKLAAEARAGKELSEAAILREVMNTVGQKGQLGESVRCVVSVGMLSEGWDTNTVTHILGVRAFGAQLLCEQVIGRALRRQSYKLNENGLLDVEYADALGIPFDFADRPEIVAPPEPVETTQIQAIRPERDSLEITFPRIVGYRAELQTTELGARFTEDSLFILTPEMAGATDTRNSGIIGDYVDITLDMSEARQQTVLMHLTKYLLEKYFQDGDGMPRLYLYGQLKQIAGQWLKDYCKCVSGTRLAQLMIPVFADMACEKIYNAILKHELAKKGEASKKIIRALPDPFNPTGSTCYVNFHTSKSDLWQTDERKCQINYAVCDSAWEAEFCRLLEKDNNHVQAYVKNHNMGFEIPYQLGGQSRSYRPDFIVRIDDNQPEPLNLVVEVKGYRAEDAKAKKLTMENYWLPGVNNLGIYGRWDFLELRDKNTMAQEFEEAVKRIRRGEKI